MENITTQMAMILWPLSRAVNMVLTGIHPTLVAPISFDQSALLHQSVHGYIIIRSTAPTQATYYSPRDSQRKINHSQSYIPYRASKAHNALDLK